MKRFLFASAILLFILFMGSSLAFAQATGPASVYEVTITQFELYNGTSWVTASSGSSTVMDIASVNSGQIAGNFFSGLSVPDGSYTQVRVTVSNTFVISGNDGAGNYTTATVNNGSVVTTTAADEARATVDVSGGIPAPGADILPSTH